jgi:hypothetical protein
MAARRIPLEKPPSDSDVAKILRQQEVIRARVAGHIKRLRADANLSIRALAMRADISPGYLSEVEHAKRSVTTDLLVRLGYFLGVDPASLLEP